MTNEKPFETMIETLLERRKILIVEDDPNDLEILASLIAEGRNNEVRAVMNGGAAIAALNESKFDVVFLDLALGGHPEGLDVVPVAVAKSRVVIVTGLDAQAPDVLKAVNLGAIEFIPKPVTRESIRKALR